MDFLGQHLQTEPRESLWHCIRFCLRPALLFPSALASVCFFLLLLSNNAEYLLLLVSYRDRKGHSRIGNYFLKGVTDSKPLVWWNRLVGTRIFEHGRLDIRHEAESTRCHVANWLEFSLQKQPIAAEKQCRLDALFAENQSGIMIRDQTPWAFQITKRRWKCDGREVVLQANALPNLEKAQFEFGFDTSNNEGVWRFPKRIT